MIGNRIADKITSVSKKPAKELPNDETKEEDIEITTHKKRYISPKERQQIIDELRLDLKIMHKLRYLYTKKTTNHLIN